MLRSLTTAATGMIAQQTNLDIISNNMANVNTYGYKKVRAEFQDLISQIEKTPGAQMGQGTYQPVGVEIGLGVKTAATMRVFKSDSKLKINEQLAAQFRSVAAVEKEHEERYRALLHNVEAKEVFEKSGVQVWECRNCGHIAVGTAAPEVCPTCFHPQAYFELQAKNY